MRLMGKVALITGAANGVKGRLMGFGGAAAWLFAREGARVVLADIDDASGQETARQMAEEGYQALYVHLDVTREEDWQRAIATTIEAFGRLDVLVNGAGTGAPFTVEETTLETWEGQMAVHARGAFLGMKYAIPEMRRAGGGSIINISSINGLIGSPTSTAYHAAKGAMRLLTKAAAVQYARDNIRVNSVHPGYALTPLTERAFADPHELSWRVAKVPMGRVAEAQEVAYGILYLASDEASYVTGSELVIDGGVTAQ